jgi:hypothetical protein
VLLVTCFLDEATEYFFTKICQYSNCADNSVITARDIPFVFLHSTPPELSVSGGKLRAFILAAQNQIERLSKVGL